MIAASLGVSLAVLHACHQLITAGVTLSALVG